MYSTIKNMKCFNKQKQLQNSLQIFQKGILMSITSIKGLRTKMEEKFRFTYILTDATHELLEGLSIFKSGQCVDLSIEVLEPYVNDVVDFSQDSLIDEYENSIKITDEFLNDLSSELKYDEKAARITRSTEDGLEYLAGWLAWRFEKPVYSKSRRESVPSHISDHTYAKRIGLSSSSWIDCISYGGLTKPSEQVLQWVKDLENEFNDVHGNEFKSRTNVKKELVERMLANCEVVPKEVVQLFAKARIYMRCKYLNKKRVEKALMKRLVKKQVIARKRIGDNSTDLSRSKSKKMKKIVS